MEVLVKDVAGKKDTTATLLNQLLALVHEIERVRQTDRFQSVFALRGILLLLREHRFALFAGSGRLLRVVECLVHAIFSLILWDSIHFFGFFAPCRGIQTGIEI